MSYYLWKIASAEKIWTLVNCICICIFGCKNVRRLSFFVILRHDLWWYQQDDRIFSYFFITLPYLEHTNHNKHMWSVGHQKILSPQIQKIVLASNFGDIFGSYIPGSGQVISILMSFFLFSFKKELFLCLFILLFFILNFDYSEYFYIMVLY